MITLSKENVVDYLREHVPSFVLKDPVSVSQIGDGELGQDVEGDGYCNYIFRLSDGERSVIVKQTAEVLRRRGSLTVDPVRSRYEYEIMEIRSKIVPRYVPRLYYGDFDNNIIVMEDVSNLKLIRFQLNKNHYYPNLARHMAHYLAATHFYTSEFYMDSDDFRKQIAHFMNASMRDTMEGPVFLRLFGADDYDAKCGPEFRQYCEEIRHDDNLQFQRYKLRHLFMSKCETLIHGDFHTSNIFADDNNMKVIDMEYPLSAPFSYDMGFMIANIITQICSAAFRPYDSEAARKKYLVYLLSVIKALYNYYIEFFFKYWDKDAKLEYRITHGYKESLALDILRECFGFAACYNFARVCGSMDTAEFDFIENNSKRTKAKFMSVNIDKVLFENWSSYETVDQALDDIIAVVRKRSRKNII